MRRQLQRRGGRDQPTDPTDRSDQLSHGVLRRDRVIEHGRVQRPPRLALQHPGLVDHRPDRVEDPLRSLALTQLVAPQRQHRRMEPLVVKRQTGRDLPTQIRAQRRDRVPIRQALQRLQHHRRRDHVGRHRRTATPRPEQIGEQFVGEHRLTVISQERVHRPSRHQMTDQRLRIQQFPVRIR